MSTSLHAVRDVRFFREAKGVTVPGRDLGNVYFVHNLQHALDLKRALISEDLQHAVVVGAGAIGLEVTEALADVRNLKTAVVERLGTC